MAIQKYPEKPAKTDYPISPLIARRWSPRAISGRKISAAKINSLFEAARWAPSSFNEQPWRFVYATQDHPKEFAKLAALLNEGNDWAKKAYLLIVACNKKNFSYNNKRNLHFCHDTGAATGYLVLEAVNQGLVSHQMAGFDMKAAKTKLKLPEDVTAICMLAVGYPGNPAELSPQLEERENRPRARRHLKEIIFRSQM